MSLINGCKLRPSCCMLQSWYIFLMFVISSCFLRHDIYISILQLNNSSFTDGLPFYEPLIVNWRTQTRAQSYCNNLFPLFVAMKFDSTLLIIIIVISLCHQFISPFQIDPQVHSQLAEQGNLMPRNYSSFAQLIEWLLGLVSKAKIISCSFVHYFSIIQEFFVPLEANHLSKELFSRYILVKQGLHSFSYDQNIGFFCLLLDVIIQIDQLTLKPLLFEKLFCNDQILLAVPSLLDFADFLHSSTVLCLLSKSYGYRTHCWQYIQNIYFRQVFDQLSNYQMKPLFENQ